MLTSSASLSFGSTDGRTCWWNSDVHVCGTMGIYGMLTYCQWQRPSVQETFKCFLDWFYFCFVGTSIYLWFCKFCLCWSFSIIETGIVVYRAFARVGNAYQKKEDFSNALLYYNKSLSEHRDSEIVKKAQEVSMIADLIFLHCHIIPYYKFKYTIDFSYHWSYSDSYVVVFHFSIWILTAEISLVYIVFP